MNIEIDTTTIPYRMSSIKQCAFFGRPVAQRSGLRGVSTFCIMVRAVTRANVIVGTGHWSCGNGVLGQTSSHEFLDGYSMQLEV